MYYRTSNLNLIRNKTIQIESLSDSASNQFDLKMSSYLSVVNMSQTEIELLRNNQIKYLQYDRMIILSDDLLYIGKLLNLVASKSTGPEINIDDGDYIEGGYWNTKKYASPYMKIDYPDIKGGLDDTFDP